MADVFDRLRESVRQGASDGYPIDMGDAFEDILLTTNVSQDIATFLEIYLKDIQEHAHIYYWFRKRMGDGVRADSEAARRGAGMGWAVVK